MNDHDKLRALPAKWKDEASRLRWNRGNEEAHAAAADATEVCADELEAALAAPGAKGEVYLDFDQVGAAGPFPVVGSKVHVPAVTVLDLVGRVPTQPEAQGEAVAWRFWMDNPASCLKPHWSEWSTDKLFKELCEREGCRVEYAYTAAPKPGEGPDDRAARMLRCLGLDGIEELPGWGWSYNRQTSNVEAMIEDGTLLEHFDDWLNALTAAQQQEKQS